MSNRTTFFGFISLEIFIGAVVSSAFVLMMPLQASNAADVHVLHVESISINTELIDPSNEAIASSGRKSQLSATHGDQRQKLQFNAFGRSFTFNLESHAQLERIAANAGASAHAFRGKLSGNERSWVRLTQTQSGLHGIVWDGVELYAIEPAAEVAGAGALSGTVIFRLADTLADLGPNACAALVDSSHANGTSAAGSALYDSVSNELKAAQAAAAGVSLQLQLSAVMDSAFLQQYSTESQAADAIIARINNVDGIFSAQVGVSVTLKYLTPLATTGPAAISQTTDPNSLLASLSKHRAADTNLYTTGITHLFTGRDLDGNTVGISYMDTVCNTTYGDSLSESRNRGAWFDSLVAAHELGHSFGVPHDGEASCASTGSGFLMAATLNGSDQFSQCSRDIIRRRMQSASCLVPAPVADISIAPDLGTRHAALGEIFDWSFIVSNLGTVAVDAGQVQIMVPASLQIANMRADNGSCTQGAGVVICTLNEMEANSKRTIDLRLQSSLTGNYQISASASASADADSSNDNGNANIVIDPPAQSNASTTPTTASPTAATMPAASSGGGTMNSQLIIVCLALLFGATRNRKKVRIS